VHLARRPDDPDRLRLARLKELAKHLGEHDGVEEIVEYRDAVVRGSAGAEGV
jgi:hypothetical protein